MSSGTTLQITDCFVSGPNCSCGPDATDPITQETIPVGSPIVRIQILRDGVPRGPPRCTLLENLSSSFANGFYFDLHSNIKFTDEQIALIQRMHKHYFPEGMIQQEHTLNSKVAQLRTQMVEQYNAKHAPQRYDPESSRVTTCPAFFTLLGIFLRWPSSFIDLLITANLTASQIVAILDTYTWYNPALILTRSPPGEHQNTEWMRAVLDLRVLPCHRSTTRATWNESVKLVFAYQYALFEFPIDDTSQFAQHMRQVEVTEQEQMDLVTSLCVFESLPVWDIKTDLTQEKLEKVVSVLDERSKSFQWRDSPSIPPNPAMASTDDAHQQTVAAQQKALVAQQRAEQAEVAQVEAMAAQRAITQQLLDAELRIAHAEQEAKQRKQQLEESERRLALVKQHAALDAERAGAAKTQAAHEEAIAAQERTEKAVHRAEQAEEQTAWAAQRVLQVEKEAEQQRQALNAAEQRIAQCEAAQGGGSGTLEVPLEMLYYVVALQLRFVFAAGGASPDQCAQILQPILQGADISNDQELRNRCDGANVLEAMGWIYQQLPTAHWQNVVRALAQLRGMPWLTEQDAAQAGGLRPVQFEELEFFVQQLAGREVP